MNGKGKTEQTPIKKKTYRQEKFEKYRTKEQRGTLELVDIKGTKEIYQWRVSVEDIVKTRYPKITKSAMKIHSPVFEVSNYNFLLRFFPYQFVRTPHPHNYPGKSLSFYLALADEDSYETKEEYPFAQFNLRLVNVENDDESHSSITKHKFKKQETDWGFVTFEEIEKVYNKRNGFLTEKGELLFEIEITVFGEFEVQRHIGIENQGATCYLNSLLQSLYMLPRFRRAIYKIPVAHNANPCDNIPYALQRLFYVLQEKPKPKAETIELTKSFGWSSVEALMQHDVQEMARVLIDRLDEKMKGTKSEGTVNDMFKGTTKSFIKCVNVDYESARNEAYLDLQLDVRGCKHVNESFEKYCELELLSGENQYRSEEHGLQDAQKGSSFISFPKVLMLQLKRFEYDWQYDMMRKVNDRYEFAEELSLKDYLDEKHADAPSDYVLSSVLVHQGDVSGGHYFMFSYDFDEQKWYRFDDEFVNEVNINQVNEASFGDNRMTSRTFSISTAYMLIYLRKDTLIQMLEPIPITEIPKIIVSHYDREKKERERRIQERKERPMYCYMTIITKHHIAHSIHRNQRGIFRGSIDYVNVDSHLMGNEKSIEPEDPLLPMMRMRVKKESTVEAVSALIHSTIKKYEQHKRKKSALKSLTSLLPPKSTGWGKLAIWEISKHVAFDHEMTSEANRAKTLNAIYGLEDPKPREFYVYIGDFNREHQQKEHDRLIVFKTYKPANAALAFGDIQVVPQASFNSVCQEQEKALLADEKLTEFKIYSVNEVIVGGIQPEMEYGSLDVYEKNYLPYRLLIRLIDINGKQEDVNDVAVNADWSYARLVDELIKFISKEKSSSFLRLWSGRYPKGRPFVSSNVKKVKELLYVKKEKRTDKIYYELLQRDVKLEEESFSIPIHVFDQKLKLSSEKSAKVITMPNRSTFAEFVETVKRKGTFASFKDIRLEFVVNGEVVLDLTAMAKKTTNPSSMRIWLFYSKYYQSKSARTKPLYHLSQVRTRSLSSVLMERDNWDAYESVIVDHHYLSPTFFSFPNAFIRLVPSSMMVNKTIKDYMVVHRVENINMPFVDEPFTILGSHDSTLTELVNRIRDVFPKKMHAKMTISLITFNGSSFQDVVIWVGEKIASARAVHSDAAAAAPHLYSTKPSLPLLEKYPPKTTFSDAYQRFDIRTQPIFYGLAVHHPSFARQQGFFDRGISIKK
mmetsp:Transcript_10768/g.15759  ORF Transcript_10768/g.15759 Transcript_10768/m.15759 type:complete len:1196 (+) Transcript_10768:58-3645(+)